MKRTVHGFLLAAAIGLLMGGCASDTPDPNHVSSIPWNRPEQWEGQGALGGMAPNSR